MKDGEKLLGGYATGTLTEEERSALFEAALGDQRLFDALADEEVLRELLDDPESRKRLLTLLEETSSSRKRRLAAFLQPFHRPLNLVVAGGIAAAAVAVLVFINLVRDAPRGTRDRSTTDKAMEALPPREDTVRPEPRAEPPQSSPKAAPPPPNVPAARAPGPSPQATGTAGQSGTPRDISLDVDAPKPAFGLSLREAFVKGPARQLFDEGIEPQRRPADNTTSAPPQEQKAERRPGAARAPAGLAPLPQRPPNRAGAGLSLALETRGPDGAYVETAIESTLEKPGQPRLAVETNTDGYLYAGTLDAGTWHWLFPLPRESRAAAIETRVRAGERIAVPLDIDAGPAKAPGTRLLIILSQEALPRIEMLLSRAPGHPVPAGGITAMLEELAPDESFIVEQASDKRLYFVSTAASSTAPLVIELDVVPR